MLKRIITAVFALCILVPILVFSDTVVFPCAVALVTVIALFEAYRCIDKAKKLVLCVPAYLFALVSPFIVRYVENRSVYVGVSFAAGVAFVVYLFFFTVAIGVVGFVLGFFSFSNIEFKSGFQTLNAAFA